VAPEAAVVFVAADDPLQAPLEDPDDASLGAFGVWRSMRATTRSPWSASFMLTAET